MDKNNGMITKIWGPPAWIFLHCVTMGYPVEFDPENEDHVIRRESMIYFFNSITNVFPCKYCRESYAEYIRELPIEDHLSTRVELARWFYDIHNKVNYKLGIPLCDIPEFIEVYNKYEQYRAKCTITEKTTVEQRKENEKKGCIEPHDGIPKKCIVEIQNDDGKKLHDYKEKPIISHDVLVKFYEGKKTPINNHGINELLEMNIDRLIQNTKCIYLLFPQMFNDKFNKLPILDKKNY